MKTIVRVVLLLFVVAAAIYMVAQRSDQPTNAENTAATNEAIPIADNTDQVLVYYFHGEQRCPTCLKIEKLSSEAMQTGFAEALQDGRVVWQVVNYEQPENAHFVDDYELYTKSVIVVKMVNGEQVEWKNLPDIWELVNDDAEFIKYVDGEVRAYMSLGEA